MSFSALAGGADCGPVNPLSQLSKAYNGDRGVQQDHYNPVAGSSSSSGFRARPNQQPSSNDEAALFFHQQQQQQQLQQQQQKAFDLQSLHRNLPQHQQSGAPAWAQAFSQSIANGDSTGLGGSSIEEQEVFRRAFGGGGGGGGMVGQAEWKNDFVREREREREESRMSSAMRNNVGQQEEMMGMRNQVGNYTPLAMVGRGGMGMNSMGMGMHQSGMMNNGGMMQDRVVLQEDKAIASTDWETAFLAQESFQSSRSQFDTSTAETSTETYQRPRSPLLSPTLARDALAQTAGDLLSTVENNQRSRTNNLGANDSTNEATQQSRNDKFANSTFLDLMRKLRDGEVAVEGDKVVEQIGQIYGNSKGKGKASAWGDEFGRQELTREEEGRTGEQYGPTRMKNSGVPLMMRSGIGRNREMGGDGMRERQEEGYRDMESIWQEEDQVREARETAGKQRKVQFQGDGGLMESDMDVDDMKSFEQLRQESSVPMANVNWEEDFDASMISGGHALNAPTTSVFEPSAQQKEWDILQGDWDNFDATATGFRPVVSTSGYVFASNNPYIESSTRTHSLHSNGTPRSTFDSILEKEAAVQRNPTDPQGWLALGIKQQENEREDMAIKALNQALALDPHIGEAYLALAVSYTNENERSMSYGAIDKWIDALGKERYPRETDAYRDLYGPLPTTTLTDRHDYLTGLLIRLARSKADKDGEDVDADVQIGLGVLFNASEEYDKAGDCFESALSVRPDDPLLFNRLGATLANSGKTELAIQYYLEALEIQPTYVRARFNLAVANMNLSLYDEAVGHLLTALAIQEADSAMQNAGSKAEQANSEATSQTLWDSLNTALLMLHRSDLASHAMSRDLNHFRSEFPASF